MSLKRGMFDKVNNGMEKADVKTSTSDTENELCHLSGEFSSTQKKLNQRNTFRGSLAIK